MKTPQSPDEILASFKSEAPQAQSLEDATRLKNKYLGRSGLVSSSFDSISSLPPAERKDYGRRLNELKNLLIREIGALETAFSRVAVAPKEDFTLPAVKSFSGGLHPLTQIQDDIVGILRGFGFSVATGPEAELITYNFDMLNTPPWHPARDLTDTFYLDVPARDRLLRTHTSPVQIRVMKSRTPPIRIVAPGRTYRSDKPDATHSPVFMQMEGLYVDRGVTFGDLKGTVLAFYRSLFGRKVNIRLRPGYFPFTEPSAEVDMSCVFCSGKGCRVCKSSGWLELAGAGMVHPNVLKGAAIDPEVFSGWAFGFGLERIAILKYGVDDIRLFYENDIRFLSQF